MAVENGIQIARRVAIAIDALSPRQQAALKPWLLGKEQFLAQAKKPGVTRKISSSRPLFAMRAGPGLRIIFESRDDAIVVRDLMPKATMDHYLKRKGKVTAAKKVDAEVKQGGIKGSQD